MHISKNTHYVQEKRLTEKKSKANRRERPISLPHLLNPPLFLTAVCISSCNSAYVYQRFLACSCSSSQNVHFETDLCRRKLNSRIRSTNADFVSPRKRDFQLRMLHWAFGVRENGSRLRKRKIPFKMPCYYWILLLSRGERSARWPGEI